ncbi:histidine decarboxylase [Streptoalloteichus tenebrarius]|uniref:Histidine decarboxylase n=1 Tax=Streptoalloteichus tenebrarius (strain ATCC 17920 / DSM 40477 / JCM 4838 / CBS 697.72 / NBRC 16177 / NCIMB 11028 / NRRL B-12390 / A12253. 1 / ISP 5477) TaxID=1933 RepID=A0ABT1I0C4_STRSD|nr:hypothetical protein [Streptoalloteichus tenebrarius]MCP2261214.1 histidine decarboxylase [Streptoalloteichus tenebrarius]
MTQARRTRTHSDIPYGPDGVPWSEMLLSEGLANGHPALISDPVANPREVYPRDDLPPSAFELPPTGLSPEKRHAALIELEEYVTRKRDHFLGYQANQDQDHYRLDLSRFMESHVNNVGDPFTPGNFKVNSKVVERCVLDYYAALWNAKWPHDKKDPESYWGYMLSMGCTEGNLYGLWNGRDYLSGKALVTDPESTPEQPRLLWVQAAPPEDLPEEQKRNALHPVAFFSEDSHYSLTKAMRVLGIDTFYAIGQRDYPTDNPLDPGRPWPKEVPSERGPSGYSADGPGSIDVDALAVLVEFFAAKGHPILVNLNLGSTFKGAYDDVRAVSERLFPIFKKYGLLEREIVYGKDQDGNPLKDTRRGFWLHVDGALGAAYLPFLRMAADNPNYEYVPEVPIPEFDFGLEVEDRETGRFYDMVHSIAMSGHKWIGAPWPCGVFMTKVKYQMRPPDNPAYIGSPDTTFAGSRNGFSPIVLWDYLAQNSYDKQISMIREAQRMAHYTEQQLLRLQETLGRDLMVARTPLALTVRFRRPNDEIIAKWSLSSESLKLDPNDPNSRQLDYVHVFLMPWAKPGMIDELVKDLHAPNAFPPETRALPTARPAREVHENALSLAHVPHSGRGFE